MLALGGCILCIDMCSWIERLVKILMCHAWNMTAASKANPKFYYLSQNIFFLGRRMSVGI